MIPSLITGVAFIGSDAVQRIARVQSFECRSFAEVAVNGLDFVKFAMMGWTVLILLRLWVRPERRFLRLSGLVSAGAAGVTAVANTVEHCARIDAFGLVYVVAVLIAVVSAAGFAAGTAISGQWRGWILFVAVVGFFLLAQQGGGFIGGTAWIALGAVVGTQG